MALFAYVLFILLCLFVLVQPIYNVFFHPLRAFPGPKLTAASQWPWVFSRIRGKQVPWITELHRQYGDVVRVAPSQLSYINEGAWKDIYGHKTPSDHGNLRHDLRFFSPPAVGGTNLVYADDANHARMRRNLSHAFSEKALTNQQPLIRNYVNILTDKLRDAASVPENSINILRMLNFTTFDVMADLTFGESLGMLKQSEYIPWPFITGGAGSFRALAKQRDHAVTYAVERVERRLSLVTTRPDIWAFVMRHGEGKGLTKPEMYSIGSTIMVAGAETTATALGSACFYLCTNREKLDKLNQEIRQSFHSLDKMVQRVLARLPYLNACLQESLRVFPPAPFGMPRHVPTGENAIILGKNVPGRTTVYVSHYAAYHHPSNFHDPDNFHPERWLPNANQRFVGDRRNVFKPFSFGPRNCLGKNLAWHEMRIILASIIWSFDMQLAKDARRDWPNQKAYLTWEKPPLQLHIKPRA